MKHLHDRFFFICPWKIEFKCVEDTDVELGKLRGTNKKKSHFKLINQEEELKILEGPVLKICNWPTKILFIYTPRLL